MLGLVEAFWNLQFVHVLFVTVLSLEVFNVSTSFIWLLVLNLNSVESWLEVSKFPIFQLLFWVVNVVSQLSPSSNHVGLNTFSVISWHEARLACVHIIAKSWTSDLRILASCTNSRTHSHQKAHGSLSWYMACSLWHDAFRRLNSCILVSWSFAYSVDTPCSSLLTLLSLSFKHLLFRLDSHFV